MPATASRKKVSYSDIVKKAPTPRASPTRFLPLTHAFTNELNSDMLWGDVLVPTAVPAAKPPTPKPQTILHLPTTPLSLTEQAERLATDPVIQAAKKLRDQRASEYLRIPLKSLVYDETVHKRLVDTNKWKTWQTYDRDYARKVFERLVFRKEHKGTCYMVMNGAMVTGCASPAVAAKIVPSFQNLAGFPFEAYYGMPKGEGL